MSKRIDDALMKKLDALDTPGALVPLTPREVEILGLETAVAHPDDVEYILEAAFDWN